MLASGGRTGVGTRAADAVVRLVHRGQVVTLTDVPPGLTVLDWLREHEHRTGTKEGCRTGDCGACTVLVAELAADRETVVFRPLDSCLTLVRALDGRALWTVEDLVSPDGALHPVQQSFIDHHGSQCGFCTPGMVMSIVALQLRSHQGDILGRDDVVTALAGNLCRCTGYQAIIDSALAVPTRQWPGLDESMLRAQLRSLPRRRGLADLLQERRARPGARVVAGGTDVCVLVEDDGLELEDVLLLAGSPELTRVERGDGLLVIGAATPLEDAWAALSEARPRLASYAARFAGPQVRAAGTIGGNLATASPIGDSAPVLLALDARVRLASVDHERTLPLEAFFCGYRETALRDDELLVAVEVPEPVSGEQTFAFKHSRRVDDDISVVSLALSAVVRAGVVDDVRVGVGGAADRPRRARATERALHGRTWEAATFAAAAAVLREEFAPIDDVRGSADLRRDILVALLERPVAVWTP